MQGAMVVLSLLDLVKGKVITLICLLLTISAVLLEYFGVFLLSAHNLVQPIC